MSREPWIGRPYYAEHNPRDRWTRKAIADLDALAQRIEDWPPIIRNGVGHEIESLRREAATLDGHTSAVNGMKARVTRLIEILAAEIDRVVVEPDPAALHESKLAYDGSAHPQRGPLLPLQRDIVCRAIRHEINRLMYPPPVAEGEPSFLAREPRGDDDVEVQLLRHASYVLTPRED